MRFERSTATVATTLLALLLGCSALEAGEAVDETRSAEPDGTVSIEMVAGTLTIEGWDRNEVRVQGQLGDHVREMEFESRGRHTGIELTPSGGRSSDGTDLDIRLPAGSDLEIESVAGAITVTDVEGRVSIETVSGKIRIGGRVDDAEISAISGVVDVESDVALRRATVESVSSRVTVEAELAEDAKISLETVSGTLVLSIPEDTPARYDISTFSGKISNDFGPRPERTGQFVPGQTLEFKVGAGTARVNMSAFSGRVDLKGR